MDADGLPIVGPGIDYSKVGAIHQKRTLAFLNHFVTHTARFLNRFSCVCEEKLADLSIRLQRLDTTMAILEAKLNSIPGLENVTAPVSSTTTTSTTATTEQQQQQQQQQQSSAADASENKANASQNGEVAGSEPEEPEKPQNTVSQHPRYAKYFKMLHMGVPAQAIKLKMGAEGLDTDILDKPDAPAPASAAPAAAANKDESDESDFSDDEDDDQQQQASSDGGSSSDFSD